MGLKILVALLLLGLIAVKEINGSRYRLGDLDLLKRAKREGPWDEHEQQHDDDDLEEEDPEDHHAAVEEGVDPDEDDFECLTHNCTFGNGSPPIDDSLPNNETDTVGRKKRELVEMVRDGRDGRAGRQKRAAHKCQDNSEFLWIVDRINNYRVSNGLSRLHKSKTLCNVADWHTYDLVKYRPHKKNTGSCTANLHSWSTHSWTNGCCYDSNRLTSSMKNCMWNKPKDWSSGFGKRGYEISAWYSDKMTSSRALNQWKRSSGHHNVILERGSWGPFYWIGGYMRDGHAVVWFAEK